MRLRHLLLPFVLLGLLQAAQQQMINDLNANLQGDEGGEFELWEGHVIFNGQGASPAWAVEAKLTQIGFPEGSLQYGTGGLDLFKAYTKEEFLGSPLGGYYMSLGYQPASRWTPEGSLIPGAVLLANARDRIGANVLERIYRKQQVRVARRELMLHLTQEAIPQLFETLFKPRMAALVAAAVLLLIGLPIIISKAAGRFFTWLFVQRPTILGEKDTDIYKSWWARMRWKFPDTPAVITNKALGVELRELVRENRLISKDNKGSLFREPKKTPYPHVLAYGLPGVGKTLFAKNLAKQSGMHFMYLTVSSLSQLGEEEALRTLKEYFAYANKYGPCVLIIDEADRLFNGADIKAKKLTLLFQQEFSKAVHERIQLFFITNYPGDFPAPILNRLSKVIHFDVPAPATQRRLFVVHLKRALAFKKETPPATKQLEELLKDKYLEGLVGRDIEAICFNYSLQEKREPGKLIELIAAYKAQRKRMKTFAKKNPSK